MAVTTAPGDVIFLLAESNDSYAELTQTHLRKAGVRNPLLRFRTGQEMLNFLHRASHPATPEAHQSFLLLVDIQLPQMDGVQVWQQVKAEPAFQDLPFVMLTTNDDPGEVATGCQLGLQAL